MPTPGSHAYDVHRTRLRDTLHDQGVPSDEADQQADDILQRQNQATPPGALDDRAAGPYGDRGGGGDPGAVIALRSPAFSESTLIPARFSHEAGDVSPPLEWPDVPDGTVELALLCEDPDAPNGTFLHWLVTGIEPSTRSIREGQAPPGATAWRNGYGSDGYGGPMPPVGDDPHRYAFRLFALGSPLGLRPGADLDAVRDALDEKHLATGTLTGLYAR